MKILLGDYNAKAGREDIFKPTTENKSLHKISNDNEVKSSKSCHIQKCIKSTMLPHCNINTFTWTFPDGKTLKLTIF
jgi:hypothetical protein